MKSMLRFIIRYRIPLGILFSLPIFYYLYLYHGGDIFTAIRLNDSSAVKRFIKSGADLSYSEQYGMSPLVAAIQQNNPRIVTMLIDAKADVNEKRNAAASIGTYGHGDRWWLDRPIMNENTGYTPLLIAIACESSDIGKKVECIDTLLRHNADVNVKNNQGMTPLLCAAAFGNTAAVRLLVERGADVNPPDSQISPLLCAAARQDFDLLKYLVMHHAKKDVKDSMGRNPFYITMLTMQDIPEKALDVYIVKFGELFPVDVNTRDSRGRTLLMSAARAGCPSVVLKKIISMNPDMTVLTKSGGTALHLAAFGGNADNIATLADAGIDVNKADSFGLSPLHVAVINDNIDAVKMLIEKGADIDAEDLYGRTPLMWCIWTARNAVLNRDWPEDYKSEKNNYDNLYSEETLECLLALGAHPELPDKSGVTPLQLAKRMNAVNKYDMMQKHMEETEKSVR
jgi:ankyrin repeat protein